MLITRAKLLKVGDKVRCPADRGSPEFVGVVRHVGTEENTTFAGTPYIWVTVRGPHESVWPSNRLN